MDLDLGMIVNFCFDVVFIVLSTSRFIDKDFDIKAFITPRI